MHRPLQNLVLEGRNADGSTLLPIALRDVDAPHRGGPVRPGLRSLQQRPEVLLQLRRIGFARLAVHSDGAVLARPSVRFAQPLNIHVVCKRGESCLWLVLRQLRYPLEFREDALGAQCLLHRSLQQFHVMASPSLHGVPVGPVPPLLRYYETLRIPSDRPSPASFPSRSRYHRHPSFAPVRVGRPSRAGQGCCPASPTGCLTWRRTGLPGSLGDLCVHALLFDPGGSAAPARSLSAPLLPSARFKASAPTRKLSRLNHTACTLAVYASQPGLPLRHARLASGWGPAFPGRASHPRGPSVRFLLSTWLPPHPGFSWRTKRSAESAGFRSREVRESAGVAPQRREDRSGPKTGAVWRPQEGAGIPDSARWGARHSGASDILPLCSVLSCTGLCQGTSLSHTNRAQAHKHAKPILI